MNNLKLNVVYLASGYPTADNPSHGIFNQRAANAIKEHVNLTVIQYRIYKPGRKFFEKISEDGFTRLIICVPYIPIWEKKMYYINNRLFYFFTRSFAAAVFSSADMVHAGDGNLGVFAAWLKKKYHFRLLVQFIGGDLNQDLVKYYKKDWMQAWTENIDGVSFNSYALQQRFHELFHFHQEEKVIYRGVDTGTFFPSEDEHGTVVFYFLGGLPDYTTFKHGRNTKGGMNLMQAWSKLDAEVKGNRIKLVFAGPDSEIPMVKEWRRQLNEPGRVELPGKITPDHIPDFHRKGNIALVPSLEEGLPNVAMEAAATGNLVIANPVGGIPEFISHKENGLLCSTNDAEGLYEQMKWALENREEASGIAKKASAMVAAGFSSKDFGKKYVEFYKQILKIGKRV